MKKYLRRGSSQVHHGNATIWPNYENSNEEVDDGTTCKICEIPWIELTEECGDWVECNICKEYICPKCYDKRDIYADFFVVFATDPKY